MTWCKCCQQYSPTDALLRLTIPTPILILGAVHSGNLNWIAVQGHGGGNGSEYSKRGDDVNTVLGSSLQITL